MDQSYPLSAIALLECIFYPDWTKPYITKILTLMGFKLQPGRQAYVLFINGPAGAEDDQSKKYLLAITTVRLAVEPDRLYRHADRASGGGGHGAGVDDRG